MQILVQMCKSGHGIVFINYYIIYITYFDVIKHILKLDKVDFRRKKISGNKEDHYVVIKGSAHLEDILILDVYAIEQPSWNIQKWKMIEPEGETDKSTILVGDFHISL